MASETETTQQEKPVYKKIIEYKKKISLVEGKRRAVFNKYEQEKTCNREKERELDIELKVFLCSLDQTTKTKDLIFRILSKTFIKVKLQKKFF